MKIVMFYHSLISDWNHGNAHFLRGIATELIERGHEISILESRSAWSVANLVRDHGEKPLADFRKAYPRLHSIRYDEHKLDIGQHLASADLAIVHEWNSPGLVKRIGEYRAGRTSLRLLFHDTHHRSATDPAGMALYDLSKYDGVLAFGQAVREIYLSRGWANRAWTWHEAADTRVFRPLPKRVPEGDIIWIGNWGDEERTAALNEFFIEPAETLGLESCVYGCVIQRMPGPCSPGLA